MNSAVRLPFPIRWQVWTIIFGAFLGLGLVKFGNPIILDAEIPVPSNLSELWNEPWPAIWGLSAAWCLSAAALWIRLSSTRKGAFKWQSWRFWLPLVWFVWQVAAAGHSVDATLSRPTLAHFSAFLLCWWLGCYLLPTASWPRWLLIGILVALAFCLVRAANQRWGGFRRDRESLLEGQRTGWTNYPVADLAEMQRTRMLLSTNNALIINPLVLVKLERARVSGTLVYPNALAGALLLLLPISILLALRETVALRPPIRFLVIGVTLFLGLGCFIWTGSKSAWLIAVGQVGLVLADRPWSARWRTMAITLLVLVGLITFAIRFRAYFAAGATSVSARFDYWQVAWHTALDHPGFGTGPGTFMRSYAQRKAPEAEMTRLVHNDYLEQFSDSGIPGGLLYVVWVGSALWLSGRTTLRHREPVRTALWLGAAAWFIQGFVEFSLYIPGMAVLGWTFLGALTNGDQSLAFSVTDETSPTSTPRRLSNSSASNQAPRKPS